MPLYSFIPSRMAIYLGQVGERFNSTTAQLFLIHCSYFRFNYSIFVLYFYQAALVLTNHIFDTVSNVKWDENFIMRFISTIQEAEDPNAL